MAHSIGGRGHEVIKIIRAHAIYAIVVLIDQQAIDMLLQYSQEQAAMIQGSQGPLATVRYSFMVRQCFGQIKDWVEASKHSGNVLPVFEQVPKDHGEVQDGINRIIESDRRMCNPNVSEATITTMKGKYQASRSILDTYHMVGFNGSDQTVVFYWYLADLLAHLFLRVFCSCNRFCRYDVPSSRGVHHCHPSYIIIEHDLCRLTCAAGRDQKRSLE